MSLNENSFQIKKDIILIFFSFLLYYIAFTGVFIYPLDDFRQYQFALGIMHKNVIFFPRFAPLSSLIYASILILIKFIIGLFGFTLTDKIYMQILSKLNLLALLILFCVFFTVIQNLYKKKYISYTLTFFLGFSTLIFNYSNCFLREILSALFILSIFLFIILYDKTKNNRYFFLLSLLSGLLLLSRRDTFIVCLCILFYFLIYRYSIKNIIFYIFSCLIFFIVLSFYYKVGNNSFSLAKAQFNAPIKFGNFINGIYAYLFSPGFSIFVYSPVLILSVFSFHDFKKKNPKYCLLLSLIISAYFILYTTMGWPLGTAGWGPRYMVKLIPLILIFSGMFLENLNFLKKFLLLTLFFAGVFIQLICSLSNYYDVYYEMNALIKLPWETMYFIPAITPIPLAWRTLCGKLFEYSTINLFWLHYNLFYIFIFLIIGFLIVFIYTLRRIYKFNFSFFTVFICLFIILVAAQPIKNKYFKKTILEQFYFDLKNPDIFIKSKINDINFRNFENKNVFIKKLKTNKYGIIYKGKIFFWRGADIRFMFFLKGKLKLFIDDKLLLNETKKQYKLIKTEKIDLKKGWHNIKVIYENENDGCLISFHSSEMRYFRLGFNY